MAGAFVGGAALGAAFGELFKVVKYVYNTTVKFKSILNRLMRTLSSIEPIFYEIGRLNGVLDRPKEETIMFTEYLQKCKDLVLRCSTIQCWNLYKKLVYSNKLTELDRELVWFFHINVQAHLMSTSMRIELDELKWMLFKDDTSVVVLSAPAGCGKTTLAKMLCHDDEIKGRFVEHIFYVTVSRTTSLTTIVQKLFEHHRGARPCGFQTDEQARYQLEILMRQIQPNILLVLDDVWPESESIIQKLKLQIM